MQSQHSSKKIIEPVIKYVLKDYGLEQNIAVFINNLKNPDNETVVPTTTEKQGLQVPCNYTGIEHKYGWHWDIPGKQQVFSPGIRLSVSQNSLVKPIGKGQVIEIAEDIEGRAILIKHDEDFYSFYACLEEILVEEDMVVSPDTNIGKTGESLYFEIRNQDGPLNPNILFE
jgi:murein DD-endopeptidase MepM/ murein hydrolase activator NlpD